MQVEVIEPHGMCAGVNGAIAKALALAKARPEGDRSPIWCLHELVRNEIVIGELIPFEEFGFEEGGSEEYRRATEIVFGRICDIGVAAGAPLEAAAAENMKDGAILSAYDEDKAQKNAGAARCEASASGGTPADEAPDGARNG